MLKNIITFSKKERIFYVLFVSLVLLSAITVKYGNVDASVPQSFLIPAIIGFMASVFGLIAVIITFKNWYVSHVKPHDQNTRIGILLVIIFFLALSWFLSGIV